MNIIDRIKKSSYPFLIAEIGVNYYDIAKRFQIDLMSAAKLMIDEAKKSGCDAVKFQSYKAEKLVVRNSPAYWDISKECTPSQYELFKKFDKFGPAEYEELYNYCSKNKIQFAATPFDYEAVDYLEPWIDFYKISSSDLSNIPFVKYIAGKKKPVFLSTGASTIDEIEMAVNVIREEVSNEICLMHCVLDYPTRNKDANLSILKTLRTRFPQCLLGYSDHTMPDEHMLILTVACLYGARVIEKHFTLDKKLPGNDHYHAADPGDFIKFRKNIELVQEANGGTIKKVLDCEKGSRKYARRSLVSKNRIKKGLTIKAEHLTCKRPGTGISPYDYEKLVNSKSLVDIEKDTILEWEMFEKV
jgi:N-acetylneuraminate synthase